MHYWTYSWSGLKVVSHSEVIQGVSDHQAVILEVKWRDTYSNPQEERSRYTIKQIALDCNPSYVRNMKDGQARGRT